jgi:hypothetical protein
MLPLQSAILAFLISTGGPAGLRAIERCLSPFSNFHSRVLFHRQHDNYDRLTNTNLLRSKNEEVREKKSVRYNCGSDASIKFQWTKVKKLKKPPGILHTIRLATRLSTPVTVGYQCFYLRHLMITIYAPCCIRFRARITNKIAMVPVAITSTGQVSNHDIGNLLND